MPQSLANVCVHVVFSTKNRQPLITDDVRGRMHEYMVGALRRDKCAAVIINSVEDHAHILTNLSRTITMSDMVKHVKESSSRWIKTRGPAFAGFAWQAGYGVFAVSESQVGQVRRYVERQREHHRRMSFEDEYRELLTRHKIEFDERYFLD